MEKQNEALLDAWLQLTTAVNNSRLVSELSFKESLICNLLYKNLRNADVPALTATDLCIATKMQKSQMNRTLTLLESKSMITRERSNDDLRRIHIVLNLEQAHVYLEQHAEILAMIEQLTAQLGPEKTQAATALFNEIASVANKVFYEKEKHHA